MSWKDTKNIGDIIDNTDWNEQAQVIIQTSGAFWAHSSNSLNPHGVTLEQARLENNTLNGTLNMGGFKILNLAEPSSLSDAASKEYVDRAVTSLGAAYYLTDKTDSDTGYKVCSLSPPSGAETYIEVANLADNTLIGSWISDIGESPSILLKGVFNWFSFLEKVTGTKTLRVYWKMFERSGSSETEIASSAESNEITSKESHIIPLLLETDYTPWSGSRIVGKLYARVEDTGSAPTIRVYYQGISPSRWEIPANSEIFKYILVPYSGAKKDVYLGDYCLTASGLTANQLTLDNYSINEISNDTSLSDNSQTAVPTEYAVKVYSDTNFYPSSIGAGLSGSFHTHKSNSSAHHARYTDEEAQDAVGLILDDGTLGEVVFSYDDSTPKIYATVQDNEIDHNQLANTHNLTSDIDHGSISGLDDDDHPQYYNQTRISTISSNALSGQQAKAWLNASGSKYDTAYQHSQITTGNPHNIDLSDIGETKGDLSASSPLSFTTTRQVLGGATTLSISKAGSTSDGYLSSTDWNTFNNKQDPFTFGTLSNGIGIQSFSVGISGTSTSISVDFGRTDTTVASGSHLHDDRYYTQSESDQNFFPSSLGNSHINDTSNPHSVTYAQVGAIQDAADTVKDTHIDWGTGTNQVSLDDIPDGNSYAKLTTTEKTDLTDGNDTTLHYHSSDRNLSNSINLNISIGL